MGLQPTNPSPPIHHGGLCPGGLGALIHFPSNPGGSREGAGRDRVPMSPCPHQDAGGGGGGEEGHGPVPARPGGPNAVSPGGGRGSRSRVPVPPALLRSAGRCQPRHGGARGGKRKGTGAALLVLPGLREPGSAPRRTHRIEHAGPGSSCPGGCEVKWVGTPKPGSQGAAMRENRGAPPVLPQFPRLQRMSSKSPGCPLPHAHPTAITTAVSCWNGGPCWAGGRPPHSPHPTKTLTERVGDPRRAQPPNTDQFAASIPRRKNKVKTSVNL